MANAQFLDSIPPWLFFALTAIISLLSIEAGLRLGRRRRRLAEHEEGGPVGSVIGATLGLLAFMLAFTFGMTASRFDTRKQLLLDEVNAIGTTYLRTGLLLEPHRTQTRRLLREYVEIRAGLPSLIGQPDAVRDAIARSEAVQDSLWSQAEALAEANRSSEMDALFISALNDMIDLHTRRVVVGTQYRIPVVVWSVLYLVSVLAMASVGFQFGLTGKRSPQASVVLVVAFSSVIFLICIVDRPGQGGFAVDHQPLIDLQKKMQAPGP